MKKWEYATENFSVEDLWKDQNSVELRLNNLGYRGWELVSVSQVRDYIFCFLKRLKE